MIQKNEMEEMWDQRAAIYNEFQQKDSSQLPKKITTFFLDKGMLTGKNILDVGGGAGRYGVPFAHYANQVTLTDISAEMLKYASENAKKAGVSNVVCQKIDWDQIDTNQSGFKGAYDFVFASMCPSIRKKENFAGIEKMIESSRKWCGINQFIYHRDSLYEELATELGRPVHPDPHNDREFVQNVFNWLWQKGYDVQIHTLQDQSIAEVEIETIVTDYQGLFEEKALKQGKSFREIVCSKEKNGKIEIVNDFVAALIYWEVGVENKRREG